MIKIAPSILSADLCRLGADLDSVSTSDYIHFDVMDGIFVPNISIGIPVLKSVRKHTEMVLDVHLMITEPLRYVRQFAEAGADIIVFHLEADYPDRITEAAALARSLGRRTGIAIKPGTPADALFPFLDMIDLALVMTVEPGFGGQSFMADMLPKISSIRREIDARSIQCELEVDGGINPETARLCIDAGANVLVAGSDIFRAEDRAARIALLRCQNGGTK